MSSRSATSRPAGLTAPALQVFLLGPPRVEWAGRPLPIPRRQARALLYRLASRLKPVPREQLCFLFWPDTPEATARRNLTRLLSHLRRSLPDAGIVLTSGDQVGLEPQRVWSDVTVFEGLCAAQEPYRRAEALRRAADLYRGPFLAGFSLPDSPEFETWASLERQTCERKCLEALSALIEAETVRGAYDAAIACAQRYLATDDLAEDVHRRLIELHVAAGDRSAALRQYERCAVILERELGVNPLPETQAVYHAALEGAPLPGVAPVTKPAWATLPGLDVPLVGRDDALRWLGQAYARARAGQGGVALISGEAGIGKSRLMQDFATRLQDQTPVLVSAGHPEAQTMPYQPVIEALRAVLSSSAPLFPGSRAQVWLAEASRLLPELRDLYPDLPVPVGVEPEEARARLFEALCQLILGLAAGPYALLLCLDDLHWADDTTLHWLAYLGRRLRASRLLVIGTCRGEEAGPVAALRQSLTRLGVLSELKLAGLDAASVLRVLRHQVGPMPGDEALATRLQRATGGNPFFLLETLRVLLETGQPLDGLPALEDLPLADTVRKAIKGRLERLSARARQVLEAGAVLGLSFSFDLVRQTAGRGDLETMDGLDELVGWQVLEEQPAGYQFHHEVIRAVVYQGLSYGRRRLLHRRAGEILERLRPGDAAALAWHFERAEEPGRAAEYALQAGQRARAVFAYAEARAYFDRALTFLEQDATRLQDPEATDANLRLRVQALDGRGWAFRLLGDMEAYARDSHQMARLAGQLRDQRTLAHLRWREAYTHRWFCRYAEALEAAEDGLRLSQAAADRLLEAMCWREVGMVARATGDYDRARAVLEQALRLFVDLGEVVYEIHVLGNLSTLYWRLGEYEKAMDLSRQALARCDQAGLPLERRLPLGDMGAAATAMGDVDLARECLLESLTIARRIADRTEEILCLGHLGWLAVRLERPAEALEKLEAALDLAERIDSRTEQSWLLSGLAEAYRLAGDPDQAVGHAHRALELARAHGRAYDQELARRVLAGLAQEGG